jgi:hypothetical protein
MKLLEMEGFLRGKCFPGDIKVNETNAEYLVRKFTELEQKLAESQREFRAADATIENLQMQVEKLAAENAGLKSIQAWAVADVFKSGAKRFESTKAAGFDTDDCLHDAVLVMLSELKTPSTDAFMAEVRSQARNEGINYAAGRLAAAFNYGFVDKPLAEVFDVVHILLTTKEDLANDPLPATDGLSGEYAEKFLAEFAAQLRQGGKRELSNLEQNVLECAAVIAKDREQEAAQ